jgi:hypothetical protein
MESNHRPSPYHLGAQQSIKVVEAAQKPVTVISGRCWSVRLLHLLLYGCAWARLKTARPGMIIFVSVSMFDHKPERCPFGHSLWPGMAQVGCPASAQLCER